MLRPPTPARERRAQSLAPSPLAPASPALSRAPRPLTLRESASRRGLATLLAALYLASASAACAASSEAEKPAASATAAAASEESQPLHPCKVPGLEEEIRCARLMVFENREAKAGRKIPIGALVLPATGAAEKRQADPVVFLAGGPGATASSAAGGFAQWKELRETRDVVLIDQRGTGLSYPLECRLFGDPPAIERVARELFPLDGVAACRKELEKRADLTQYTTASAVDDFDDMRAFLGYERWNLLGGSYGTVVAQVYLRRHAARVRVAILDGISPVDELIPIHHAYAGQRAVDLLFKECAADAACHAAFPDPKRDLAAVMAQVERGVKVKITHPLTKAEVEIQPSPGVVAEGIRTYLYDRDAAGNQLPRVLRRAAQGDFRPLLETALGSRMGIDAVIADGLFFSVTCAEDLAFLDDATIARETRGTFGGDHRVREQRDACKLWPIAKVGADTHTLVTAKTPTLLFSGERDPVTPPEFGDRVAKALPQSLHVVNARGSHGSFSPCATGLMVRFYELGKLEGLDPTCSSQSEPTKFAIEDPKPAAEPQAPQG